MIQIQSLQRLLRLRQTAALMSLSLIMAVPLAVRGADLFSDLVSWHKNVSPTQLAFSIEPTASTFPSCAAVTMSMKLENRSAQHISFLQNYWLHTSINLENQQGVQVKPTGVTRNVDIPFALTGVEPNTTKDLGKLQFDLLYVPFTQTDCPPGSYTLTIDLNLAPGQFVVKSNQVQFKIN